MTKPKKKESQKEQSARFKKAVQDMIDDGDLDPIEADERFERAINKITPKGAGPASQK